MHTQWCGLIWLVSDLCKDLHAADNVSVKLPILKDRLLDQLSCSSTHTVESASIRRRLGSGREGVDRFRRQSLFWFFVSKLVRGARNFWHWVGLHFFLAERTSDLCAQREGVWCFQFTIDSACHCFSRWQQPSVILFQFRFQSCLSGTEKQINHLEGPRPNFSSTSRLKRSCLSDFAPWKCLFLLQVS